ncbi:DUF305 domain-containing protein [Nocardiopsis kunsanensis]|uniref:Lipoprotein n=1 Tax=Nocardiopsis kunsanensis TaxID=141693 RepID=A0A919CGA2_9ACTN|nr:DUF305 domain-containing protein [Nocardiopsis kunsanensis]GHD20140.1 lipoprotein [Nocardiopsis kunsanensis]
MMTTTTFRYALNGAAAALGISLALTACGQGHGETPPDTGSAGQEQHNGADVEFARMMIPHHEQAVEMADLAHDRAGDEVGGLSEEIRGAQGPEIERMQQMLQDWGADDTGGDTDHSGMPGMLSDTRMEELAAAEGEEFDTLFLELMIEHHEGAVDMAGTVMEEGTAPEAQQLAEEIEQTQEEEIEQMRTMLGNDPSAEDAEGSDGNHDTGDGGSEDR